MINKYAQHFLLSLGPIHRKHETDISKDHVLFSWWECSCILDVKIFADGWIQWESTIEGNKDSGQYQYKNKIPTNLQHLLQKVSARIN